MRRMQTEELISAIASAASGATAGVAALGTRVDKTEDDIDGNTGQIAVNSTDIAALETSKADQSSLDATNSAVAAKADKTAITVDTTTTAAVLAGVNNSETRYQATLASLTLSAITAPAANAEFIFGVVFTSGTTATTLTNTLGATFTGDATSAGVLTPVASKGYNIVIWWDGAAWQGVAREA